MMRLLLFFYLLFIISANAQVNLRCAKFDSINRKYNYCYYELKDSNTLKYIFNNGYTLERVKNVNLEDIKTFYIKSDVKTQKDSIVVYGNININKIDILQKLYNEFLNLSDVKEITLNKTKKYYYLDKINPDFDLTQTEKNDLKKIVDYLQNNKNCKLKIKLYFDIIDIQDTNKSIKKENQLYKRLLTLFPKETYERIILEKNISDESIITNNIFIIPTSQFEYEINNRIEFLFIPDSPFDLQRSKN